MWSSVRGFAARLHSSVCSRGFPISPSEQNRQKYHGALGLRHAGTTLYLHTFLLSSSNQILYCAHDMVEVYLCVYRQQFRYFVSVSGRANA